MTDAYQDTVRRMEPDVAHVDLTGAAGSIAISLRRIADVAELAVEVAQAALVSANDEERQRRITEVLSAHLQRRQS